MLLILNRIINYINWMDLIRRYFDIKEKVLRNLGYTIGEKGIEHALMDGHHRRRPRACGLTVHTGVGCPIGCLYCYIYDMGFPSGFKRYPLNVDELLYAVISNPYFVPGREGTLLAMGSVTEPFIPKARELTFTFISRMRELVNNPVQISTKYILDTDDIKALYDLDPELSILVSIVAYGSSSVLEPSAPPVEKRIGFLLNLAREGFYPSLFLRPIIPGITDHEFMDITSELVGRDIGIVLGGLRITLRIINNLSRVMDVDMIKSRISSKIDNRQKYIDLSDLKSNIKRRLLDMGFNVYPAACSANIISHKLGCRICKWGPCGDLDNISDPNYSAIKELAQFMNIDDYIDIHIHRGGITLVTNRSIFRDKLEIYRNILKTIYKIPVYLKK
jgi:DNA repair photolyase